jgi:peptidoglycan/LPS O-acetylase OafA/YrhL
VEWQSKLRRVTSGGRFIAEVDGFRFLAILIVLLDHVGLQVLRPNGLQLPGALSLPEGGVRGVYLFFSISGFILGLPFARRALTPVAEERFRYSRYLLRRLTRLEPPYVLMLLLRLGLLIAVMHEGLNVLLPHFFASLLYLHNLCFAAMSPVSPPTWSLEVEVQFYFLAPLLASIFRISSLRLRRACLMGGILLCAVLAPASFTGQSRLSLSLLGNLHYFLAGFLLCDLYVLPLRMSRRAAWDACGILAMAFLLWSDSTWTRMIFPFATVALYLAGFHGGLVRKFFAHPFVSIVGGMCYSIYLTHGTVLALAGGFFLHHSGAAHEPAVRQPVLLGTSLIACLAVGSAYFILVERPCMQPDWPARVRRRWRRDFTKTSPTAESVSRL